MKTYFQLIAILVIAILQSSCNKSWLDEKPDIKLVTPVTIEDCQAILNNEDLFNRGYPGLQDIGTTDLDVTFAVYNSAGTEEEKNAYIWQKKIFTNDASGFDWKYSFNKILNANIVLESIEKFRANAGNGKDWNNIKGSALFYRAFNFYNLAQLFCKPYIASSASSDLGLPLKVNSLITEKVTRATVKETYDQILNDLLTAKKLLPLQRTFKTQPSKVAAYAMLSRTYLAMQDYDHALAYADSALQINGTLLDFSTLDYSQQFKIPLFNDEVIFHATNTQYILNFFLRMTVSPTLYQSYEANDLRKAAYFTVLGARILFYGSYGSTTSLKFIGLANDELYLNRAECYARKGNTIAAMRDLNELLRTRWAKAGGVTTYIDKVASGSLHALQMILDERRKELPFRGVRWTDLRRLNLDPMFAQTLTRSLNNINYSLPPNDPRYVLPIPDPEIRLSGIVQNER